MRFVRARSASAVSLAARDEDGDGTVAAMRLLEAGKAERMLVSGVNREASREDIRDVSKAVRRLYDCCVDLGFEAANTRGNARETAEWAAARGFDSLIIVTADYHMPRAMLELGATLPDAELQAYPVPTPQFQARDWWRTSAGARLMTMEYLKYLAILGRETVLGLGPQDEDEAPAAQPAGCSLRAGARTKGFDS